MKDEKAREKDNQNGKEKKKEKKKKKEAIKSVRTTKTKSEVDKLIQFTCVILLLVSWCFEPSQPQRITPGLPMSYT